MGRCDKLEVTLSAHNSLEAKSKAQLSNCVIPLP